MIAVRALLPLLAHQKFPSSADLRAISGVTTQQRAIFVVGSSGTLVVGK